MKSATRRRCLFNTGLKLEALDLTLTTGAALFQRGRVRDPFSLVAAAIRRSHD